MTGNYMAATAAPTGAVTIEGDRLRWFSCDDDRNVAYGFCGHCGSTLFFRSGVSDDTNEITAICVGSIEGASGLHTEAIWFADNAADHVRIDRSADAAITRHSAGPTGN